MYIHVYTTKAWPLSLWFSRWRGHHFYWICFSTKRMPSDKEKKKYLRANKEKVQQFFQCYDSVENLLSQRSMFRANNDQSLKNMTMLIGNSFVCRSSLKNMKQLKRKITINWCNVLTVDAAKVMSLLKNLDRGTKLNFMKGRAVKEKWEGSSNSWNPHFTSWMRSSFSCNWLRKKRVKRNTCMARLHLEFTFRW